MTESTKKQTKTTRPAKLLDVYLTADNQIGVLADPTALIEDMGPDPANWAGILAAAIHTIVMEHCSHLVHQETGEAPAPELIYRRLLSTLEKKVAETMGKEPTGAISLEEFLS